MKLVRNIASAGIALGLLLAVVALAQSTTAPTTAPATQPARPEKPKPDEGWVSGTVLDVEGKIMVGLEVRAERQEPMGMGGGRGPAQSRWPKVVNTTTDEEGYFLLTDLQPEKEYIVVGGNNEIGWVYEIAMIEAGKEKKFGQLKMVKLD